MAPVTLVNVPDPVSIRPYIGSRSVMMKFANPRSIPETACFILSK